MREREKERENADTVSDWQVSYHRGIFRSGKIFSFVLMNMWLSLVGYKKASKQFGDISKAEKLFIVRAECFL